MRLVGVCPIWIPDRTPVCGEARWISGDTQNRIFHAGKFADVCGFRTGGGTMAARRSMV